MKLKDVAIKGLLLVMCASTSACVFNIQGNSNNTFPIQDDGSLDMTAASVVDVNNMKISGLFLQGATFYDVELLCASKFEENFYQSIAYSPNAVTNNVYTISSPEFQSKIKTLCKLTPNDDDNYELNLAVKVGTHYMPMLGPANLSCYGTKVNIEHKNLIQATAECIAQDSRTSSNVLGLNSQVEPINKLKVILSEDYVDQL